MAFSPTLKIKAQLAYVKENLLRKHLFIEHFFMGCKRLKTGGRDQRFSERFFETAV